MPKASVRDKKKETLLVSNTTDPAFNSSIKPNRDATKFEKNLQKYLEFTSWCRWYPDLFLDLIKPEMGGIILHADQRVFLRSIMRFQSVYAVYPRGYGKTMLEVLGMILIAIFYPGIELALTAQTKENAAELLKDKYIEIMKFYPLLKNEIFGLPKFQKGDTEILFTNGSRIDILANAQTSKGQRRKRLSIEESALLNNVLFEDALEPIVIVGRSTVGKNSIVDPEELNHQINFFTTSGFRASDEYARSVRMLKGMENLSGEIVLGGDWHIACWYGRCPAKSQMLKKKESMSPIAFAQNYSSRWVGSSDGSLVDITKLLSRRNLLNPESKWDGVSEYFLGLDVARSIKTGNNISAVIVLKVIRNSQGKVKEYRVVNIYEISNTLDFTAQAVEVKKIKKRFNARITCMDTNGLGIGLHDELLKESFDPLTDENLGCWNTINTDATPEIKNSERCLYDLKPQSSNSQIITNFIDMVEGDKLRLLIKKPSSEFDLEDMENKSEKVLPYLLTDSLIEEVSNLKLKTLTNGKVSIEQVIKNYNKDKYSALAYVLWYVKVFEESVVKEESSFEDMLAWILI